MSDSNRFNQQIEDVVQEDQPENSPDQRQLDREPCRIAIFYFYGNADNNFSDESHREKIISQTMLLPELAGGTKSLVAGDSFYPEDIPDLDVEVLYEGNIEVEKFRANLQRDEIFQLCRYQMYRKALVFFRLPCLNRDTFRPGCFAICKNPGVEPTEQERNQVLRIDSDLRNLFVGGFSDIYSESQIPKTENCRIAVFFYSAPENAGMEPQELKSLVMEQVKGLPAVSNSTRLPPPEIDLEVTPTSPRAPRIRCRVQTIYEAPIESDEEKSGDQYHQILTACSEHMAQSGPLCGVFVLRRNFDSPISMVQQRQLSKIATTLPLDKEFPVLETRGCHVYVFEFNAEYDEKLPFSEQIRLLDDGIKNLVYLTGESQFLIPGMTFKDENKDPVLRWICHFKLVYRGILEISGEKSKKQNMELMNLRRSPRYKYSYYTNNVTGTYFLAAHKDMTEAEKERLSSICRAEPSLIHWPLGPLPMKIAVYIATGFTLEGRFRGEPLTTENYLLENMRSGTKCIGAAFESPLIFKNRNNKYIIENYEEEHVAVVYVDKLAMDDDEKRNQYALVAKIVDELLVKFEVSKPREGITQYYRFLELFALPGNSTSPSELETQAIQSIRNFLKLLVTEYRYGAEKRQILGANRQDPQEPTNAPQLVRLPIREVAPDSDSAPRSSAQKPDDLNVSKQNMKNVVKRNAAVENPEERHGEREPPQKAEDPLNRPRFAVFFHLDRATANIPEEERRRNIQRKIRKIASAGPFSQGMFFPFPETKSCLQVVYEGPIEKDDRRIAEQVSTIRDLYRKLTPHSCPVHQNESRELTGSLLIWGSMTELNREERRYHIKMRNRLFRSLEEPDASSVVPRQRATMGVSAYHCLNPENIAVEDFYSMMPSGIGIVLSKTDNRGLPNHEFKWGEHVIRCHFQSIYEGLIEVKDAKCKTQSSEILEICKKQASLDRPHSGFSTYFIASNVTLSREEELQLSRIDNSISEWAKERHSHAALRATSHPATNSVIVQPPKKKKKCLREDPQK